MNKLSLLLTCPGIDTTEQTTGSTYRAIVCELLEPESVMTRIPGTNKVRISKEGIAMFNAQWQGSELRSTRAYWYEFDNDGDLINTDVPEQDDGLASVALSHDAEEFFVNGTIPDWFDQ